MGEGFAFVVAIASIVYAIYWMVVGWRAMRAHEDIAAALEDIARKFREPVR